MTEAATKAKGSTKAPESRLGKLPIELPKGVSATITAETCEIKGPKGTLKLPLPESVVVTQDGDSLLVKSNAGPNDSARLQGLARALIANNVKGCAEGFNRTLELVGVGYRAELKGQDLHLALGLSHTVVYPLPTGVVADVPKDFKGTIIHLSCPDKAVLGQASASIRSFRPPEPYGGKGVRYKGEQIRRKAGKAGKK